MKMNQRYHIDVKGAKAILICLAIGLALMATPLIT